MFPFRRCYSNLVAYQNASLSKAVISQVRNHLLTFGDTQSHIDDCKFIFTNFIKDGNYDKSKIYNHILDFNNLFIQKMTYMVSYKNEGNGNVLCLKMLEYFLQNSESFNGSSFVEYFDVLEVLKNLIRNEASQKEMADEKTAAYLLLILESYLVVNPNIEAYSYGDMNDLFFILRRCPKNAQSFEITNKLVLPILENPDFSHIEYFRESLLDLLVYQKRYFYLEKIMNSILLGSNQISKTAHTQVFRVVSRIDDVTAMNAIIKLHPPTVVDNHENLAHYFLKTPENLLQNIISVEDQLAQEMFFHPIIRFQKVIMEHLAKNFDSYDLNDLLDIVRTLQVYRYYDIGDSSFIAKEHCLDYYQWRTVLGLLAAKINIKETGSIAHTYEKVYEFLDATNIIGIVTPDNYKELCDILIEHYKKDEKNGALEIKALQLLINKFENREKGSSLTEGYQ